MQLLAELLAIFIAAILFVGFCGLATYIFQSVFHYDDSNDPDLKLFTPEEQGTADETLYPLQHPSNFTDFR